MSLVEILILAVVQGVTEFLPISSSGHLVVVAELLEGVKPDGAVNVVLHAGTLLSILVFFRRRIALLAGADRRVIGLLIAGTVPAAALGLLIRYRYPGALESSLLAGCMLIVTGVLLLGTRALDHGGEGYEELSPAGSVEIGLFQALALLPGISRSGATIFGGLLAGLDRRAAATFSFLLAIPAIGGASALELVELLRGGDGSTAPGLLIFGCAVAFVVGLASLGWLFRWIEGGKLHYFAYYCLPIGAAVVIWQLA